MQIIFWKVFVMKNQKALEEMQKRMELRGFAKSTQRAYLTAVQKLSEFHSLTFEEMGYSHVRDFLLHAIQVRNLSSQYINTTYSGIKFLFEATLERDWNMKHIPRIRKSRKFPETLLFQEVKKLLEVTTNLKHKAALALAYSAGLRVSEVSNLKITDIDSKTMRIFIRQGKGKKDRYAQLAQKTLEILREYFIEFRPKLWLFQSESSKNCDPFPISTRTIQNVFQESRIKAGITKKVSPHSLRHSYATHLVEKGTNLIKVKDLLGHDKLETTMLYIHLASKDVFGTKSPMDTDWDECDKSSSSNTFEPSKSFKKIYFPRKREDNKNEKTSS